MLGIYITLEKPWLLTTICWENIWVFLHWFPFSIIPFFISHHHVYYNMLFFCLGFGEHCNFDVHHHGLRTPREEIAFTARPKIPSHSQIFRYGQRIFCLPHWPNFSDIFDLCLHWVSVVRVHHHPWWILEGENKESWGLSKWDMFLNEMSFWTRHVSKRDVFLNETSF